jgi:hypothetical protein
MTSALTGHACRRRALSPGRRRPRPRCPRARRCWWWPRCRTRANGRTTLLRPLPDPRRAAAYQADQVDLVLGDGARDRRAHCDRVAYSKPGVGYVMLDGHREPAGGRSPRHPTRRSAGSRPLTRPLAGGLVSTATGRACPCRWPVRWLLRGSDAAKVVGSCHEAAASKAGNVRRETRRHTAATDCRWSQHRL